MLTRTHKDPKRKGFTLTEAAIVLGIVGLILGAIWVAAAAVYNNLRISNTSEQLLQIVQSIRSMHATSQSIDTNVNATVLAQAGAIPKNMFNPNDAAPTVRDVWGGNVTISSATVNGVDGAAFKITMEKIPREACSDILVRNTGSGRDSGLVNAGTSSGVTANTSMPITVTTAIGYCSDITANNTLSFTFMLKS